MPEPKPIPERIRKIFTDDEFHNILNDMETIMQHGHGAVLLIFKNHHYSKWEQRLYNLSPKSKGTYQAE